MLAQRPSARSSSAAVLTPGPNGALTAAAAADEIKWFSARWFGASMAMGGIALAVGNFPYAPDVFRRIAVVPWLGNVLLLTALYLGFAWRMLHPARRLYDDNEPLYYGFGATALCSVASTTALLGDLVRAA